jgi:hypothetical protein
VQLSSDRCCPSQEEEKEIAETDGQCATGRMCV